MVQAVPTLLTFDEFIAWHPNDGRVFELIEGVPLEVNPTGPHEKLSVFLSYRLNRHIDDLKLPFFLPKTVTLKPDRERSGYKPDVAVLDEREMIHEPRWVKESTILNGPSVSLAIEIASTNWRDDYGLKLGEYELMGIPEYWIVDYLAIAAVRHIGTPKEPTVSVYGLADGEYRLTQFRRDEKIDSKVFPALELTVADLMSRV